MFVEIVDEKPMLSEKQKLAFFKLPQQVICSMCHMPGKAHHGLKHLCRHCGKRISLMVAYGGGPYVKAD